MAKTPAPVSKFKGTVDTSILSEDEVAELQLEAEKKVADERKEAAKAQLRATFEEAARRDVGLEEEMVDVHIDLAPYCERVLLDNKAYLQGKTYTVRAGVAAVLGECMQKTWRHQSEIDGKSENYYRRMRTTHVSPNGVVNTSQGLRA